MGSNLLRFWDFADVGKEEGRQKEREEEGEEGSCNDNEAVVYG